MEDDLNALIDCAGSRADWVWGHVSPDGLVRGAEAGNESSSVYYEFEAMSTEDFEDLMFFNSMSVEWVDPGYM